MGQLVSKKAKKRREKQQEANAYFSSGEAYRLNNQFQTSIEHYEKALEIAKEHEYKKQETHALLGLGDVYRGKNQFQTAIEHYQKALEIAKEHEYKKQETQALLGLGHAYNGKNQFQTAIEHYQKALEIAKEHGYKQSETQALAGLGHAYRGKNQFQTAIEHYQKALGIAREHEYTQQETQALVGLGDAYRGNNQFQKAFEHYEKALEIAKEHEYKQQETHALLWLGHAYSGNNQFQTAIKLFKEALEIAKRLKYTQTEKQALLYLRDAYKLNNQFQNAIQRSEQALQIEKGQGDKNHETKAGNTMKGLSKIIESSEGWKWEESSIVHREKFIRLKEYGKNHPEEIKDVNGVRFCSSQMFSIGKGSDGTRVYVGLGKDGYERAVKRLPRDSCACLAEQEKKVLNEVNTTMSNSVVSYWFLDDESDKDWLFLILDICEETLKEFVDRSSLDDLTTDAPDIIHQVLKGLADLHQEPNPILHRDLKPSNILRDVYGNWLLADFGISRILTAGSSTHQSEQRGTDDWTAVESSHPLKGTTDDCKVRYKKESDIQVAGIVAFYIVTKGEHPFGEKPDRLRNLLDGNPVGLGTLKDPVLKDLLSWMLSHDPKGRPSAKEALKHPYLQPAKQQFEMLCKMGNQPEIKTRDVKSDVVRKLNSDPKDWRSLVRPDVLNYLSTDSSKRKTFHYMPSWTDCLRLIRNVKEHWHDRPRPRPEVFYLVGDPQEYFLNLFPNLPVETHRIVRSCDWKERPDLKEYFI